MGGPVLALDAKKQNLISHGPILPEPNNYVWRTIVLFSRASSYKASHYILQATQLSFVTISVKSNSLTNGRLYTENCQAHKYSFVPDKINVNESYNIGVQITECRYVVHKFRVQISLQNRT